MWVWVWAETGSLVQDCQGTGEWVKNEIGYRLLEWEPDYEKLKACLLLGLVILKNAYKHLSGISQALMCFFEKF